MRIIHGYKFLAGEIAEYRDTIYKNVVLGMKVSGVHEWSSHFEWC